MTDLQQRSTAPDPFTAPQSGGHWRPSAPAEIPATNGPLDFEALALPQATALYRAALHLTQNPVEAEDLTQETYLRAYRGFASFRGGDIRAWLFTILRHAFLDDCRKRGRVAIVSYDGEDEWFERLSPSSPSAEAEVLRGLPSEAIERAFAQLPADWRLMLLLADVEELSYREIADVLDVPQGTVMSRLHRARKRMQASLLTSPSIRRRQQGKSA